MVQIGTPSLPRRLYRYRNVSSKERLEREIEAISENYLWFSQFEELNDPMEGIFGISATAASAPDGPQIPTEVQTMMRQTGVCCFSDTYENDLMWIHYAGDYRGICVKYSTHDLGDGLTDVRAVRMQYDIQAPILRTAEAAHRQQAAIKALSSKKSDWYYEREWRLLTYPNVIDVPGFLKIEGQNPVKGIYFGPRTEPKVIDIFVKALSDVRDGSIKYYRPTSLVSDVLRASSRPSRARA